MIYVISVSTVRCIVAYVMCHSSTVSVLHQPYVTRPTLQLPCKSFNINCVDVHLYVCMTPTHTHSFVYVCTHMNINCLHGVARWHRTRHHVAHVRFSPTCSSPCLDMPGVAHDQNRRQRMVLCACAVLTHATSIVHYHTVLEALQVCSSPHAAVVCYLPHSGLH